MHGLQNWILQEQQHRITVPKVPGYKLLILRRLQLCTTRNNLQVVFVGILHRSFNKNVQILPRRLHFLQPRSTSQMFNMSSIPMVRLLLDFFKIRYDPVAKKCEDCESPGVCGKCSASEAKCLECKSGFFREATPEFSCAACIASCDSCQDATSCSKCSANFSYDPINKKCIACSANCNECSTAGTCDLCN